MKTNERAQWLRNPDRVRDACAVLRSLAQDDARKFGDNGNAHSLIVAAEEVEVAQRQERAREGREDVREPVTMGSPEIADEMRGRRL